MLAFFTSLINIGAGVGMVQEALYKVLLTIDGWVYQLVSHVFKLFMLVCSANMNTIVNIAKPIVDRIQAVIMVLIVYKIIVSLISSLLKPEDATTKEGGKLVTNIFITAILLISYNTIFGLFNDVALLIVGNPTNYPYTTLSRFINIDESDNKGLIMRFVFGDDNRNVDDVGDFLALKTVSIFIHDYNDETKSTVLESKICSGGDCDFTKLSSIAPRIGMDVEYHGGIILIVGIYLIYCVVKSTIEVGIRLFKLLVLQILAPVAIISIVADGVKGKTFSNYIKTYMSVFIDAFVRMAAMLIVMVFVCKIFMNIGDIYGSMAAGKGWVTMLLTVVLAIAAFKFASDLPKFIKELFPGLKIGDEGKGGFGKVIGGIVGGGIGAVSGLATGTLGGFVGGLAGGVSAGTKGKNVADFFKGQAENGAKTRNLGANIRMAGGTLDYAGARAAGFLGIPQGQMEKGKLAEERKTAMDNMIKQLEDNYDAKVSINGQEVGVNRDIFRNYAYDEKDDTYGFFSSLSDKTKDAVRKTNAAATQYTEAQGEYDRLRSTGTATSEELRLAYEKVESTRTAYQTLKSSSDKKVDTDFNSKMLRDIKNDPNLVKEKGRLGVERSIETYDNVADKGFTTTDFINDTEGNSNTKKASDHYETLQDQYKNSRSATAWNRSNTRGGK